MNHNNWMHFEYNIDNSRVNKFLIALLETFPNCAYFDRQHTKDSQKIRIHIRLVNENILHKIEKFREIYSLSQLNDYSISDDIADLFQGPSAEKMYLQFSIDSMSMILDWLKLIDGKKTTLSDIAFSTMSQYVLHTKINHIFLNKMTETSLPLSFLSFRSHSDGYFVRMEQEDSYRKQMENLYQTNKEIYSSRFKQLKNNDNSITASEEWMKMINKFYPIFKSAIKHKGIQYKPEQSGYIADSFKLSKDNFHYKTQHDFILNSYIRRSQRMKILRLMTGLMYLTLHRLGLNYLERNFLCYAIARTVEDVYQTNVDKSINALKSKIIKHYVKRIITFGLAT